MNVRAQAALIVKQVITQHRSLQNADMAHDERALIQELVYGTLRYYYRLEVIAKQLLLSPLKSKHQDLFALLLVGLYQLLYMNIPQYAAVSETVGAAQALKKPWARHLLNKTLRRFITEKNNLLKFADGNISSRYAHSVWFIDALKKAWPSEWQAILDANNSRPPMVLRVNSQKISRHDYSALLIEKNIAATIISELPNAIQLEKALPVNQLPKFNKGFCYIQDTAGQYAALLLNLKAKQRVLDACAAPGSKTTHILEIEPKLQKLIALDNDPRRSVRINENINRLGLSDDHVNLITADAAVTKEWWDGQLFDRILLDAPCSATGIIRRHPDIKILRNASDIPRHAAVQTQLLNALWPLLKKDGVLLYSTCSILPAENEAIIAKFLSKQKDATARPIAVADSLELPYGRQLLPKINGHDGFYYALLQKTCGK